MMLAFSESKGMICTLSMGTTIGDNCLIMVLFKFIKYLKKNWSILEQ
jgi:hypothetical protein